MAAPPPRSPPLALSRVSVHALAPEAGEVRAPGLGQLSGLGQATAVPHTVCPRGTETGANGLMAKRF